LRAAIDTVGPVNALAVDEHGEEVKRLEFLMTQRDDLVAARQSLQQAAREIDQTARRCLDVVRQGAGELPHGVPDTVRRR